VLPPFPTFSSSVLYTGSPSSSILSVKCRQAGEHSAIKWHPNLSSWDVSTLPSTFDLWPVPLQRCHPCCPCLHGGAFAG
jgi:hypothetical protein